MTQPVRRVLAATAATVVASALLVPLGGIAHASGTQIQYYVASKNGAPPALYNAYTGAQLSRPGVSVLDLRASQDGSRFVDVEAFLDSAGNQEQSVVVYDISGHPLNTVTTVPSTSELHSPALSPDGSVVAWTSVDNATTPATVTMYAKTLATGAVTTIGNDLYEPVFVGPSTLIVRHLDGTGYWTTLGGATPTSITPFPWEAVGMTVSPDGSQIAWEDELGTTPSTANVDIASLTVVDGSSVSIGTPTSIATGLDNYAPAFSRDGTHVLFIHANNGSLGAGQLETVSVTGGTVTAIGGSLGTVITQAVGELPAAPVTPLVQPSPLAAVLGGTAATLRWSNPSDDRVSQVLVRRYLGTQLLRAVYVPIPSTSFHDTGLVIGKTYTYSFASVDRGGNVASGAPTRQLLAAASSPSAAEPTSATATRAPFAVRFGPGSPAVRWTVDYRVNNAGSWIRWLTSTTGSVHTFSAAALGRTYQFRAQATDPYGNSTLWFASGRTVVPLDQSSAHLSGGLNVTNRLAWYGSYRDLTQPANYALITLYGNQLQIVGWRCPSCGSFALYLGKTRIAIVSTYSSSVKARVVVLTQAWATTAWRTFTIRPLGTTWHPAVLLDGFAMRR